MEYCTGLTQQNAFVPPPKVCYVPDIGGVDSKMDPEHVTAIAVQVCDIRHNKYVLPVYFRTLL